MESKLGDPWQKGVGKYRTPLRFVQQCAHAETACIAGAKMATAQMVDEVYIMLHCACLRPASSTATRS